MKILIATGIYPPDVGGPATYAEKLMFESAMRKVSGDDIEVDILVYTKVTKNLPRGISHFRYFYEYLKKAKDFDKVIVLDTISVGIPVYLASFINQKPYVLKIGGDYIWEQAVQRWGVSELLDEFLKKRYGFKIEFMRFLQSRVAKRAKKVIAPSNYLASVVEKWGVKKENICVIYNSVILRSRFMNNPEWEINARKKLGLNSDDVILLSAGRDVPWKGFEMLKDLKIPGAKIVVGSFPPEIYGLWLRVCRIYLLNTGYEGFSHQLLEAMLMGLPIITTDSGGNKEIVENERNALVVEYNNKDAWREAIIRLLKDEDLQNKLSENAKVTADRYIIKDILGETIKVLENIL